GGGGGGVGGGGGGGGGGGAGDHDDDAGQAEPPAHGEHEPRGERRQGERHGARDRGWRLAQPRAGEQAAREVHLNRDRGRVADGRAQQRARGLGEDEHGVVAGERLDPLGVALLDHRPGVDKRDDLHAARPGAAGEVDESSAARVDGNTQITRWFSGERRDEREPERRNRPLA